MKSNKIRGRYRSLFTLPKQVRKQNAYPKKAVPRPGAGRFFQGVSQKFFGPSGREAFFPGPIRKIFSRISGEGDFSRRLPIPFFLAGCLSAFDFSRRCGHVFFLVSAKFFCEFLTGAIFPGGVCIPKFFQNDLGKGDFSGPLSARVFLASRQVRFF